MLVYYQDFGSTSSYRIQNYPASLAVLTDRLHSGRFPAYAPGAPHLPPPPAWRVGTGSARRRKPLLCPFPTRVRRAARLRRDEVV